MPGLAAEQHERSRHDAAAEHAIELADARRHPLGDDGVDVLDTACDVAAAERRRGPAPIAPAGATFSSTNEFHAPQSGQRPSHFCDCAPQD